MMTHSTNPPPVEILTPGDIPVLEEGGITQVQTPFAQIAPYQVAGLTPFAKVCCASNTYSFQRFGVAVFTSYTKNGITTTLGGAYTTTELDTLFASLGWIQSGDWYYIITDDEWSFNFTYNPSLPASNEPEFSALDCEDECRESCEDFFLPVFGVTEANISYENDFTPFLFNDPFHATDNTSLIFYLQKLINGEWSDVTVLTGTSYGIDYDFSYFESSPTYKGYSLNWGQVLLRQGEGCYRIRVQSSFSVEQDITVDVFTNSDLGVGDLPIGGININIENDHAVAKDFKHVALGETPDILEEALNASSSLAREGFSFAVSRFDRTSPVVMTVTANAKSRPVGVDDIPVIDSNGTPSPTTVWGMTSSTPDTVDRIYYSCFVSETFNLKAFDCDRADRTVKFETWTEGKIGDKREDYLLHTYCGHKWYDSIRLPGMFNFPTVDEYKEVYLEWGNPYHGKLEQVRNEALQAFIYKSLPQPQVIHERLSVYGMMADEIRASDYNRISSDWEIKRLKVKREGGYEAKPFTKEGSRKAVVEVKFRKQIQGTIKTICC
jgi:hypothetical protein